MSYTPSYQEASSLAIISRPFPLVDLGGTLQKRYVRTAGNDANDGLTPATAWATVDFAISQVPVAFTNGAYYIDVTGVTQALTKSIPSPIGAGGFFTGEPSSILGFVVGALILHSDLVVTDTILAADNISIAFDPATNQQIITTSGGLVPNSLQGKLVSAFGTVNGIVKRNDAVDIYCTGNGLSAGIDLDFSEPGATLENVNVYRALGGLWIEGINLQSSTPGDPGLEVQQSPEQLWLVANQIGTFLMSDNPAPTLLLFCTIVPSDAGDTVNTIRNCSIQFQSGFAIDVSFSSPVSFSSVSFLDYGLENCGPIWGDPGVSLINGNGVCTFTEFLNPPSSAIHVAGTGSYYVQNCSINGAGGNGIEVEGCIVFQASSIPAGVGNLGFGVNLSEGAHFYGDFAGVLLTGASGDVFIGNLGASTWAAVNAAPFNRLSDYSANGDGSTVTSP